MIHANRLACCGALAASVLMLAACGSGGITPSAGTSQPAASSGASAPTSSSAATPATASGDACSLITQSEASTALGQGADAGASGANGEQCTYTAAAGNLTVIAVHFPDSGTASASFNGTRTAAQGAGVPGFEDVSGVGDHAFLTSMGLVEFEKGTVVVTIEAIGSAEPTPGAMTTLGQAAAGRV
jgi:uncharacterized protein DUF3558